MAQGAKFLDQENILDAHVLSNPKSQLHRIPAKDPAKIGPLKRSATVGPGLGSEGLGSVAKRRPKHVLGGKDINTHIPVLRKSHSSIGTPTTSTTSINPLQQTRPGVLVRSASALDASGYTGKGSGARERETQIELDFKSLRATKENVSGMPSLPYTDSLVKLEFASTSSLPRLPKLNSLAVPDLSPPVETPRLNSTNMDPRKHVSKMVPSDVDKMMNLRANGKLIGRVPSYLVDDPNSIETIPDYGNGNGNGNGNEQEEPGFLGEQQLHFLRLANITNVTEQNYYEYPEIRRHEHGLRFEEMEIPLDDILEKDESGEQDMSLDDVGLSVDDLNELLE